MWILGPLDIVIKAVQKWDVLYNINDGHYNENYIVLLEAGHVYTLHRILI